jgi:hypothetical protein
MGVRLLDPQYFRSVRQKAVAVLARALYFENPRVAVRGTKSLGRVISEFRPKMRNEPTEQEQLWQDKGKTEGPRSS